MKIPSGKVNTNNCSTESLMVQFRIKLLESQIHELESETESLSNSLDHQKTRTIEAEAVGQKRADELLKEVQKKVRSNLLYRLQRLSWN